MRIPMTTVGPRGDVQPFVALAAGLGRAGHDVVLSTAERFAPLTTGHDIPFSPTSNGLLDLMDHPVIRQGLETLTSLGPIVRQMPSLLRLAGATQAQLIDDAWEAVRATDPEVVVYHPKAYWGPAHVAPQLPLGARYNRRLWLSSSRHRTGASSPDVPPSSITGAPGRHTPVSAPGARQSSAHFLRSAFLGPTRSRARRWP